VHRTIVIAFSTLDGVVEDPDGRDGTPNGGWAFRHGTGTVAGDKFKLGPVLGTGVLLMGRKTWQAFSQLWPGRDDDFSRAMNQIPKLVASRAATDVGAWAHSALLTEDLFDAVRRLKAERDVVVVGSASIVHALAERDLVDEYRIMVFPDLVGKGTRLFTAAVPPTHLRLVSAEAVGPAVLARYVRDVGP
jgi:dihydrofolate reductase